LRRARADGERSPEAVPELHAADQQQAAELLDPLSGYISRTDGLAGAVSMGACVVTVKATGATLSVESTDSGSAWSKRP